MSVLGDSRFFLYSSPPFPKFICSICKNRGSFFFSERKFKFHKRTESIYHFFHADCIDRWIKKFQDCPTCRAECSDPYSMRKISRLQTKQIQRSPNIEFSDSDLEEDNSPPLGLPPLETQPILKEQHKRKPSICVPLAIAVGIFALLMIPK